MYILMLKLKLIKILITLFTIITAAAILLYFIYYEEEQVNSESTREIFKDIERKNVKAVMESPSIEWANGSLKAEKMLTETDEKNPFLKYTVYSNFSCILGSGSRKLTISGKTARIEQQRQTGKYPPMELLGGIECMTAGGWYIRSEIFIYNDRNGLLLSKSPVSFGSRTMTGRSDMFSYNNNTGIYLFNGKIKIEINPDSGPNEGNPTFINAEYLQYNQNTGFLEIWQKFQMTRGKEYLRTFRVEGYLDTKTTRIKQMEAKPDPQLCFLNISAAETVTNKEESSSADPFRLTGYKILRSPLIKFLFNEDENNNLKSVSTVKPSRIDVYNREVSGKPDSTMKADSFTFSFSNEKPIMESISAKNNVTITQTLKGKNGRPETKRVIRCREFNGRFEDDTSILKSAILEGKLSIKEPSYEVSAEKGVYKKEDSLLTLFGIPMVRHTDGVSTGGSVKYNTQNSMILLENQVVSKIVKRKDNDGSIFTEDADIFINSEKMEYDSDLDRSTYTGSVRIYQEKNYLFADRLTIIHTDRVIIAEGNVRGKILPNESADKSKEKAGIQKTVEIIGGKVSIFEQEKHIKIEKTGSIKQLPDEIISATTIDYYYENGISDPLKAEAYGNANYKKPPYESKSDNLNYDYKTKLITLQGESVQLFRDGKLVALARELTLSPGGDIIKIKSDPGTRIEAVWKVENKTK